MRNSTMGQSLTLKFLDGKPADLGLPESASREGLFESFPNIESIETKHTPPSCLVRDSKTGGITINRGEIAVLEYRHPSGIDYHIVSTTGTFRIERTMGLKVGQSATLLGPFPLQGKDSVEFGEQRQRIVQIFPGKMGFISYNGNVYPIDPGVYWLKSPYVQFLGSETLNQDVIKKQDFSIIRIPRGHIACYQDVSGNIAMLRADEENTRFVLRRGQTFLGIHSNLETSIVHGEDARFQRVFLQPGDIAFYTDDKGQTKYFEDAGEHVLLVPARFETKKRENITTIVIRKTTDNTLKYGSVEMVNLRDGQIVFYTGPDGKIGYFDKPGRHELKAPAFFEKSDREQIAVHHTTDLHLQYESVAILNLRQGEYAVKYDKSGKAVLLSGPQRIIVDLTTERLHEKPDRSVIYHFWDKPSDSWNDSLGPFQVVNVAPGHVAITVDSRTPADSIRLLDKPGVYILDDPQWRLHSIKQLQERRIDLGIEAGGKRTCSVTTNDRVRFNVSAFLLFTVIDPEKAFVRTDDIVDFLRRKADSLLMTLFGKHQSIEITQGVNTKMSQPRAARADEMDQIFSHCSPSFTTTLLSEFTAEFEKFAIDRGVQLTCMQVEELDFADPRMKEAMEQQSERAQKLHIDLQAMESQREFELKRAGIAADARTRGAEGEAAATNIVSMAAAQKRQTEADAEAAAIRKRAEAEADAIKIRAAAEADAARMKNEVLVQLVQHPVLANAHLMQTYLTGTASVMEAASRNGTLIPTDFAMPTNMLQGPQGVVNFMRQFAAAAGGPQLFQVNRTTSVANDTSATASQQQTQQ